MPLRAKSAHGIKLTCLYVRYSIAIGVKADIERASLSKIAHVIPRLLAVLENGPSIVVPIADLADRDSVLACRLNLKLFDRDRNRLFLGVGDDGAEVFGALADYIDTPAGHVTSLPIRNAQPSPSL